MNLPRCLMEIRKDGKLWDYELNPSDKSIAEAIVNEKATETLIKVAEEIGTYVVRGIQEEKDKLSTSQIRNIFGEVKRLQMRFNQRRLLLLKPKLRYTAARHSLGAKALRTVLEKGIDEVGGDEQRFNRFVEFFEAILCYHKAAGGE